MIFWVRLDEIQLKHNCKQFIFSKTCFPQSNSYSESNFLLMLPWLFREWKCHYYCIFFWILLWRRSSSDTYSPSDNFFSPTAVSDWLIFCCGDFILHPKKMKITKTQILIKATKKCQKSICKHKVAFFTLNLCHWLVM